ncbi:hypothetical protein B9Z55_021244 [Caenorhabditis nigoni]|nr:hypothetical protein B9Z55_021244 [Caenorhabditis nigoni]
MKDEQSVLKLVGDWRKFQMAYVETKCMVTGEEVQNYAFWKTREEPEYHGPPASQCPAGTTATSDGLCGLILEDWEKKEVPED